MKASTTLPDYINASIFQGFFLANNYVQNHNYKGLVPGTCQVNIFNITSWLERKGKLTVKVKKAKTTAHCLSQKAKDTKRAKQSYASQKTKSIQDASNAINVKQSHTGPQDVNNTISCANQKMKDINKKTRLFVRLKTRDAGNAKNLDYCTGQKINQAEIAK